MDETVRYKPICRCGEGEWKLDLNKYTIFGGWVWEILKEETDEQEG